MATHSHRSSSDIPTGRPTVTSSLPPELRALLNQFGNKFWQFDATSIAQMLSPSVTLPPNLVDIAHSMLDQKPSDWSKDTKDGPFHEPLVGFLNNLLNASHRALDLSDPLIIERDERWYSGLRFMQLGDGSCTVHGQGRGAIKREALGGISFRKTEELAIPVKLDEDWPAVMAQAARSAQILYSACHLRKFGLIIGFRYTTLELRFLIVHRGGVSASKALSVVEEQGKKDIIRVFLSVLTWRTKEDAGIPKFFSDSLSINIPAGAL
jgi:hypothetical protein